MATFRFVGSNSLKFIRTEDNANPQTDTNRIYSEYDYPNRYFYPYYMKVQTDGDLWFQYRTDYTSMVFTLHDSNGLVSTLINTNILIEDDYSYYQVNVDVSGLSGYYSIHIAVVEDEGMAMLNYKSNVFHVAASFPYTLLLGWHGSYANDVPMQWDLSGGKYQELRIEAQLVEYKGGALSTQMRGSDGNLITVNYQSLFKKVLETELITQDIVEKINIALGHDSFLINNEYWNIDGTLDVGERKGDTMTYALSADLELKDYENYSSDPELTGTAPTIPRRALQTDTGFALQTDTGIALQTS